MEGVPRARQDGSAPVPSGSLLCNSRLSLHPGLSGMSLSAVGKALSQPRQHIKKQRHYFPNKGPSSQAMVFPVVMYGCELDHKES